MKKSLLLVALAAFASMAFGVVNAQTRIYIEEIFPNGVIANDSFVQLFNGYNRSRGYLDAGTITGEIVNGQVNIESSILSDDQLYEVPEYHIYVSPYRLSQLSSGDPSVNLSNVLVKEVKRDGNSNTVSFSLSAADGLNSNQAYYAFIAPVNDYDEIGTPSEEQCFRLDGETYLWGERCDTLESTINPVVVEPTIAPIPDNDSVQTEDHGVADTTNTGDHGASCIGMDLANVSHTINNDTITLTWTSVAGGDVVEIAIFDPEEEIYRSLGAVSMSAEKFSYTKQRDGEQNLLLTNGCKEFYYKADAPVKTPTPTIVPAATGPAENIFIIAIAAVVLYGLYVVFFRKSEN